MTRRWMCAEAPVLRHNQYFGFGGTGILPVPDGLGGTGILPVPDGRDARTTLKINCDEALVDNPVRGSKRPVRLGEQGDVIDQHPGIVSRDAVECAACVRHVRADTATDGRGEYDRGDGDQQQCFHKTHGDTLHYKRVHQAGVGVCGSAAAGVALLLPDAPTPPNQPVYCITRSGIGSTPPDGLPSSGAGTKRGEGPASGTCRKARIHSM